MAGAATEQVAPFTAADYAERGEKLIEAFSGMFLSPRYDQTKPTPNFAREVWNLYASNAKQCAIAAPRNHSKSTSFTHAYILTECLFRYQSYVMLLGASEEMAIEHLGDIAIELRDNEELTAAFGIKKLDTDAKTDIICRMKDGHAFRIVARGAEQKIRGRKWNGMRPGLIVCDDLEDDEQVESKERREKFRKWFFRAAKPALADGGKIRIHGTILHEDSLLACLMKDDEWKHLRSRAHESFDEFTNILWPEKFSEKDLRGIRQGFINQGDAAGYSQEYLNDPLDNSDAFLRKQDFIFMDEMDRKVSKIMGCGVDFAFSKERRSDNTAFVVGGKCARNLIHIVDVRKGKFDTLETVEQFFEIENRYHPAGFYVRSGKDWEAIRPVLQREMERRDTPMSFFVLPDANDKKTKGIPLQKRMRSGMVRIDGEAEWQPGFMDELLRFTGNSAASKDDQFDATANLAAGFENQSATDEEDFMDDDEAVEYYRRRHGRPKDNDGRSSVTGY